MAAAEDQDIRLATASAERYVVESKNWRRGEFTVEYRGKDGGNLVFSIAPTKSSERAVPGGGDGFELIVDAATNQVLEELAYQ